MYEASMYNVFIILLHKKCHLIHVHTLINNYLCITTIMIQEGMMLYATRSPIMKLNILIMCQPLHVMMLV